MDQLFFSIPPEARGAYLQQIQKQQQQQLQLQQQQLQLQQQQQLQQPNLPLTHHIILEPNESEGTKRKRNGGQPRKCNNPSCDRIVTRRNYCFKCQKRKERGLALNPKLPSVKQILLPNTPIAPSPSTKSPTLKNMSGGDLQALDAQQQQEKAERKASKSKTVASILASSRMQKVDAKDVETGHPSLQSPKKSKTKVPKLSSMPPLKSSDAELPSIYSLIPPESPRSNSNTNSNTTQNFLQSFAAQLYNQQQPPPQQAQLPHHPQHPPHPQQQQFMHNPFVQQSLENTNQPMNRSIGVDSSPFPFQQNQQHVNSLEGFGNRYTPKFSDASHGPHSASSSSSTSTSSGSSPSSPSFMPQYPLSNTNTNANANSSKVFSTSAASSFQCGANHWQQQSSGPRSQHHESFGEMSDSSHPSSPIISSHAAHHRQMLDKLHESIMQITEGDDELAVRLAFEYFSLRTQG